MSFNQTNPNFANYQNSQLQAQGINPAPFPQIPYKPITFEKLSNLIGITYNLSAEEGKWDCMHEYFMEEKEELEYAVQNFKM